MFCEHPVVFMPKYSFYNGNHWLLYENYFVFEEQLVFLLHTPQICVNALSRGIVE